MTRPDDPAWVEEKLGQLADVVFPHQHAEKFQVNNIKNHNTFFCTTTVMTQHGSKKSWVNSQMLSSLISTRTKFQVNNI
jgi:hypothetical protein